MILRTKTQEVNHKRLTAYAEDGIRLNYYRVGETYYELNFHNNTYIKLSASRDGAGIEKGILTDELIAYYLPNQTSISRGVFIKRRDTIIRLIKY